MKEIKKIDKISLANILAIIYGLIGFLATLVTAFLTMLNIVLQKDFTGSVLIVGLFNAGAGLLLGIFTSVIMAIVGWLVGFLLVAVYNWFAKKYGGIKIELAEALDPVKKN